MKIATVRGSEVHIATGAAVGLVALLSAIPPVITAIADFIKGETSSKLEFARLAEESRKTSVGFLQSALANPDADQRMYSVRFLVNAGLLPDRDSTLLKLPADQIPHWPIAAADSM